MAKEPENLVLKMLVDIRAKLDEHTRRFDEHTLRFNEHDRRFDELDKRIEDMTRVLRYAMGQNEETRFRQADQALELDRQRKRTDEIFDKLEELLSER